LAQKPDCSGEKEGPVPGTFDRVKGPTKATELAVIFPSLLAISRSHTLY